MRARLMPALILAGFASASGDVSAQTEQEFQVWAGLFANGQFKADAPSGTTWFDLQARRRSAGTTLIVRPGVGYVIRPWLTVWLGYAWIAEFADANGARSDEHRVWEQLTLDYRSSGILLQSRTRVEQRFRDGAVAHRFRQAARFNFQPRESLPLGLVAWDELFLGMVGASWAKRGFDQNRFFVGPAVFAFEGIFRVEVGYQLNYLSRSPKRIEHVLAFNLFVNVRGER